jgi:hypothetical protein
MKVCKFIKLYLVVLPIAIIYACTIMLITVIGHIINQFKIKY